MRYYRKCRHKYGNHAVTQATKIMYFAYSDEQYRFELNTLSNSFCKFAAQVARKKFYCTL